MLSSDLALLYGVPPGVLIQAVKRNIYRFPADFMFQLNPEEFENLKSQIVTSSWSGLRRDLPRNLKSQIVISSWGGNRSLPYAFTDISSYAKLRERVKETLLEGQRKIEQQKVLSYWQTGKYIHDHLFFHENRAEYGKEMVERLSDDLNVSDTLLYQCLQLRV